MAYKKKKELKEQEYIVMNEFNEVFTGIKNGSEFRWSSNWHEAKPLEYSNTLLLRTNGSKVELFKIQDFY
jgi:hypothetical protein